MNSDIPPSDSVRSPVSAPLWHNHDYIVIMIAGTISSVGTKVSQIALPLLVLGLTQSPVWAGILGAAQQLPYLLFSLPAGAWVDRVNRKRLLVVCDLVRGALLATIPLAYMLGAITILHLLIVVFIAGICTILFEVADLAALPQVVDSSQLARARATSEGVEATATILGPSLGGVIISLGRSVVGGSVLAYLVDSASYIVSAITLLRIRRPLQHPQLPAPLALRDAIRAGLSFLWRHPTLRVLMLLTAAVNFLQAPITLLVILVAQQRFGLAPAQIGLLFGVAGGAAVLGSLLAARWYRVERLRRILAGSLSAWIVSAIVLAFANEPLLLTLGLALAQIVWPIYAVAVVSYRIEVTPDHLQGRVVSAFRALSYGAEPLGLAAGGIAVAITPPALIFGAIAAGLLLCAFVLLRQSFDTTPA